MLETVRRAIAERRVLRLTYAGDVRDIEPYCLGYSTRGRLVLRAYQRARGWRLFALDRADACQATAEVFVADRTDYSRTDAAIPTVLASV